MDTTIGILVAGLAIAAALAALAVALLRRRPAPPPEALPAPLQAALDALARSQSELSGRLSQLAADHAAHQSTLGQTLDARLEQVSQHMATSLKDTSTRTAETLGELRKHLSVIDEAQKNIAALSGQVIGLQDILSNKQARGAFGNIQLRDIVQMALPPSAYAFEAPLGNGRRADCLLRLPNPPGAIAIDAKFPLESFQALRNATDDRARQLAQAAFRRDMLKHVQDIAARYIVPGETAESALMFLPSEAVYAELHASFVDVVEQSYRARVWIVSPTTLMATLNTVRAVLKDASMREQAAVIQAEVQKMLEDVRRLGERVGKLQQHFRQTSKDVDDVLVSTNKVARRAQQIGQIELGEPVEAIPIDEDQPELQITDAR